MKRLLAAIMSWVMKRLNEAYQSEEYWMEKEEVEEWKKDREKVYRAIRNLRK